MSRQNARATGTGARKPVIQRALGQAKINQSVAPFGRRLGSNKQQSQTSSLAGANKVYPNHNGGRKVGTRAAERYGLVEGKHMEIRKQHDLIQT